MTHKEECPEHNDPAKIFIPQPQGFFLTEEEIELMKTKKGGWTKAKLAQWGIPWPTPKGWKEKLLAE
jgi:hypothetical protein